MDPIATIITDDEVQLFASRCKSLNNIRRYEDPPKLAEYRQLMTYCHRVADGYETVIAYRLAGTVTQDAVAYTFSQQDDAIRLMDIFTDIIASNRLG